VPKSSIFGENSNFRRKLLWPIFERPFLSQFLSLSLLATFQVFITACNFILFWTNILKNIFLISFKTLFFQLYQSAENNIKEQRKNALQTQLNNLINHEKELIQRVKDLKAQQIVLTQKRESVLEAIEGHKGTCNFFYILYVKSKLTTKNYGITIVKQ